MKKNKKKPIKKKPIKKKSFQKKKFLKNKVTNKSKKKIFYYAKKGNKYSNCSNRLLYFPKNVINPKNKIDYNESFKKH